MIFRGSVQKAGNIKCLFQLQLAGGQFIWLELEEAVDERSVCGVFGLPPLAQVGVNVRYSMPAAANIRFDIKLSHQIEMKKCYVSVLSGIVNLL